MLNVCMYRKEIQKKMEELNEKRKQIYQKVVYYEVCYLKCVEKNRGIVQRLYQGRGTLKKEKKSEKC